MIRHVLMWTGGAFIALILFALGLSAYGSSVCADANLYAWSFKKCIYDKSAFCAITPDYVVRYNKATSDLSNYSCTAWPDPKIPDPKDEEDEN